MLNYFGVGYDHLRQPRGQAERCALETVDVDVVPARLADNLTTRLAEALSSAVRAVPKFASGVPPEGPDPR